MYIQEIPFNIAGLVAIQGSRGQATTAQAKAQHSVEDQQVRIYTPLLTFSLLLGKIPLCRRKIIPIRRDISM